MQKEIFQKFSSKLESLINLNEYTKIAIAVSGGSDSMALSLLLKDYGVEVIGLTFDHRLREESTKEALWVKSEFKKMGLAHEILTWKYTSVPKANVMEEARKARYKALTDWCNERGVDRLLTAHHRDDVVENFFIRLEKSSGLKGLSAMKESISYGGVEIIRPLLEYNKQELLDYLYTKNQTYINDPSNGNEKYTRVLVRNWLKTCPFPLENIYKSMRILGDYNEYFEENIRDILTRIVRDNKAGYLEVDLKEFQNLQEIEAVAALKRIIAYFESDENLRHDNYQQLYQAIITGFKGRTLGGAFIYIQKMEIIFIREDSMISGGRVEVEPGTEIIFDKRYKIINNDKDTLTINRYDITNHSEIKSKGLRIPYPQSILFTLPVIKKLDKIVMVPHIYSEETNSVEIQVKSFQGEFLTILD